MKKLNESVLKLGDIILTSSIGKISKGVRVTTKSDISHAMIYVMNYSVLDSTSNGVHGTNTQRMFFDDNAVIHVLRLIKPLKTETVHLIIDYARSCAGAQYATKEALQTVLPGKRRTSNKQFCSRLIAQSYAYAGISIVENINYCTPEDILRSNLFFRVENCISPVSEDEIEEIQAIPNPINKMSEILNKILTQARKIDPNIQTLSDIHHYLIQHPEYDESIVSLYKQSGYLTFWTIDQNEYPWRYNLEIMKSIEGHDSEIKQYCEDLLAEKGEGKRRFEFNLSVYSLYLDTYQLETFHLLFTLYKRLLKLHMQRIQVAKEWLLLHPHGLTEYF